MALYVKDFYSYLQKKRLKKGFLLLSVLLFLFFLCLISGSYKIKISEILSILIGKEEGTFSHIIWQIRIPRLLAAIVVGASLSLSGCVLQIVLKNPLVSPFTLGISQGSAFGATFAIIFLGAGLSHRTGEGVTIFSYYPVVLCAFLGSLITMSMILFISSLKGASKEVVVLSGIAISAFFSALTMFIQYFAEDIQVAATLFWTFGDLGKATWKNIPVMTGFFLPSFLFLFFKSHDLNAMKWGDDVGKSLGVRVKRVRLEALLLASLVTSATTSFLGIIGFVGLLGPHIARMFIGEDERFRIPFAALVGSLILLFSDFVAGKIVAPSVLPVGIVTSFIGAPFFFYLIINSRNEAYY